MYSINSKKINYIQEHLGYHIIFNPQQFVGFAVTLVKKIKFSSLCDFAPPCVKPPELTASVFFQTVKSNFKICHSKNLSSVTENLICDLWSEIFHELFGIFMNVLYHDISRLGELVKSILEVMWLTLDYERLGPNLNKNCSVPGHLFSSFYFYSSSRCDFRGFFLNIRNGPN